VEDKKIFQALEFTEKIADEMVLPEIKNIGHFVGFILLILKFCQF